MGGALLDGWLASPAVPNLTVLDRHRQEESGDVLIVRDASELPRALKPDLIVLAVKPAKAEAVIAGIGAALGPNLHDAALLSVMAGRTCAALAQAAAGTGGWNGAPVPVMRAMPNLPAAIGAGISGLYVPPGVPAALAALSRDLLSVIGDVVTVEKESDISTVTAISGSGPAYVFLLAELMEKAGAAHGLPRPVARRLARATIYGAGRMLDDLPDDAETLRRAVTSPNGTTEAALGILMNPDAWPACVPKAIDAAAKRADELAG